MKTRLIASVILLTLLITTPSSFAADREPRLTFRQKKAKAILAEVEEREKKRLEHDRMMNPPDADLERILEELDTKIQTDMKRISLIQAESERKRQLFKYYQEMLAGTARSYQIVKRASGDASTRGTPIVLPHKEFPAKPSEGRPGILKVLVRSKILYSDVKYFVAYLPVPENPSDLDEITWIGVILTEEGLYVLPSGERPTGVKLPNVPGPGTTIESLCYTHQPFDEGSEGKDKVFGIYVSPDLERLQRVQAKVNLSPVTTVLPSPANPAPLPSPPRK